MKKYLSLLLVLMLVLVGCGKKNESTANEKEALEAYVATINKINERKAYAIEMDGKFTIPKSTLNKTEVKGDFALSGYADSDINADMKIDFSAANEKLPLKMLSDGKYVYINVENSWQKMKLDASLTEGINPDNATTYEDVKKTFDLYKNKKYAKTTVDSHEGYAITYTMDMGALMKAAQEADPDITVGDTEALEGITIDCEMFVPTVPTGELKQTIAVGLDMMGVKFNLDMNLKLSGADKKKVEIPEAAKKAPETNTNNINSVI